MTLSLYFSFRTMLNKIESPRRASVSESNRPDEAGITFKEFKPYMLNEVHAYIMLVVFFVSAFTIVTVFNITVISILEASQVFALVGLSGFLLSYILRFKFRLSLLDGLFYNLFGTAPLGLAFMFVINAQCSTTFTEIHKVVHRQSEGQGYTYHLEDNALDEYWHIRNFSKEESNRGFGDIKYTFCRGFFGYRVMVDRQLQ